MATAEELARLRREVERLQQEVALARTRRDNIYREQRAVNAELRTVRQRIQSGNLSTSELDSLVDRGTELENQYNALEQQGLAADREVAALEAQLSAAQARLRDAEAAASAPVASSGEIAQQASAARDDNANESVPPGPPLAVDAQGRVISQPPVTVPSTAEAPQADATTGTNDAVRPGTVTQSIPPPTSRTPVQPGSPSVNQAGTTTPSGVPGAPTPGARPGTVAAGDDQPASNSVRSRIDDIFGGGGARIIPQPNVLSRYASYTYNISIYLMSKQDFASLQQGNTSLSGFNLLMQSGGIPINARNQFFPLDYYLDNLNIRSFITGRGTGGAHNSVTLSFTITEPNGITFIPNLIAATQKYVSDQGEGVPLNYAAQNFLMVIRFYGYDSDGNIVNAQGQVQNADSTVGPQSIVEKYIPFQFTNVKFRIANKLTEYECEAVCPQNVVASGGARGVIPYNIELTSTTLKELLTGNLTFGTANQTRGGEGRETVTPGANTRAGNTATGAQPAATRSSSSLPAGGGLATDENQSAAETNRLLAQAPPNAGAAPNKNLVSGLKEALNRFQAEIVRERQFLYPDIYDIKIPEAILQNAKVQPPEAAAGLASVPMTSARTAAQSKLGSKQSVDRNAKNVSATAGMSIVQFLDQVVRTSTYVVDQQTRIITTDKNGKQIEIPNGVPANNFAWYRVGMQVEPNRYDEKRRDWTYKITYSLTPYKVNDVKSDYFPNSQFTGIHKQYNYWFTGENVELLDYQQDYNYLYYIVVNTEQQPPSRFADYRSYEKRAFQPRSNESAQGAPGKVFEPSANAANILYSPADTARVKIKIAGDPGWLQQGELWSGIPDLDKLYYGPFLPDGTINYDSQEILFEVRFNTPVDYNFQTGIMDLGKGT